MSNYSINYREYDNQTLLVDYNKVLCFNSVFGGSTKPMATQYILYTDKISIPEEDFIAWIETVNNAGFPCKFEGISTDKGLEWLDLTQTKYYIISVPIEPYKDSLMYLTSALSIIRTAYDADGHCGANPFIICQNYFMIKKALPVIDDFTAIMMAHAIYGRGAHHLIQDENRFCLFNLKELLAAKPKEDDTIYKGGRYLHITYNKFSTLKVDVPKDPIEYYNLIVKPIEKPKTKIYVVGKDRVYANWLPNIQLVDNLEESDVVLFTGGEDVTPSYYKAPKHPKTGNNTLRDRVEKRYFEDALALKKKMLGICRGSQFLCVMSGGKLVQDQNNPEYIHSINLNDGKQIHITSTHHQAAFPFKLPKWDYTVIGWTEAMLRHHQNGKQKEMNPPKECEIVHYKKTNALGIQGHPEHMDYQRQHPESLAILKELFTNFINDKL